MIKNIPIDIIYYLWEQIPGINNPIKSEYQLMRIKTFENNIRNGIFYKETDEIDLWLKKQIRIQYVGADMDRKISLFPPVGMENPLWVFFGDERHYFAGRGNERLCWLRAKGYHGDLPCVVIRDGFKTTQEFRDQHLYETVYVEGIGKC